MSLIDPLYQLGTCRPSSYFHLHLWRPFTAVLAERNPLVLAWTIFGVHQMVHIIEPLWGFAEVGKFCAIVQVSFEVFVVLRFFH